MKITICGSMTFSKEMIEVANKLEQKGYNIILPHSVEKFADGSLAEETSSESIKNKIDDDLIRSHFNEIKNSDAILIVNIDKNGIKNYLGGNSFLEMGFAHVLGKRIYLLNPVPEILYKDEIIAMEPMVLNGDLNLLK